MIILDEIRCPGCNRKLAELNGQAQIKCSKCKAMVIVDTSENNRKIYIKPERRN